ncbi:MAG: [FeFe] hydrogenase H-cluster radical SAM maturase HydG [bacterium]
MTTASKFSVDEEYISSLMNSAPTAERVEAILNKALELKGLSLEESAVLLNVEDEELLAKIAKAAKSLKEKIYGKRIVMFAPLYLSNYCVNNCLYCGFRVDNKEMARKMLTVDEVVQETAKILEQGHKRILLVAGEDTNRCNLDFVEQVINKIYEQKIMNGEVRRLNINIAPLKTEEFERLAKFGLGTYQCFQETYHRETYKIMHPSGLKANYEWRLATMDRALSAGLHDVGMGVLFGLTDYRFEVLALLSHADYLDKKFGVGPHTLSIPRIEPADGSDVSEQPPHAVDNKAFKKIVSILRLSVPYTGIILSTRENAEFRRELLEVGVSQVSAGSKTNPGGYNDQKATEQFSIGDTRSLDEVICELAENDFIPSFCTSCYRVGRVGKDFMDLAKPGLIQKFCNPNALVTFAEYLSDYASEHTKEIGFKAIEKHVEEIKDEKAKAKVIKQLDEIKAGQRDLFS